MTGEMLPQHDLDAQRTLGRAWITLAGHKALELEQAEAEVARLKAQIDEARLKGYNAGYEDCWHDGNGREALRSEPITRAEARALVELVNRSPSAGTHSKAGTTGYHKLSLIALNGR